MLHMFRRMEDHTNSKSVGCSVRCTSVLAFSEVKGLWIDPTAFYSVKPLYSWDKLNSDPVWLSFNSLTFQVSLVLVFLTYMVKLAVLHLCGASDTDEICISSTTLRFEHRF